MSDLDDASALGARDPGGMLRQVADLPAQLRGAAAARGAFRAAHPDPLGAARPRSVLVCGMGGSAIGGDLAAAWAERFGLRVAVHRGYGLPGWVDPETLLVFSSYSGGTEETLSGFAAAAALGAPRICITTGGMLAARAREAGVGVYSLPAGLQPRAALGHSLAGLLVLLHTAGLGPDPLPELESTARHLEALAKRYGPEVPEAGNHAKQLARLWHGHLPVLYTGPGITQPVGARWKGQVNENAKCLAHAAVFPELDHNEIMGWQALPGLRQAMVLVLLRDRDDGGAVERRMRVTAEIVGPRVAAVAWVDTAGETVLGRMLGAVWLGDWASVYLAFLNGVDPTPVPEIDLLKRRLAEAPPA